MSPNAAVLIIGNEILSGRTQDTNIQYLAKKLGNFGITLEEARVIPDKIPVIVPVVLELSATYTHVFTTGGIGATHDDKTAAALAQAFKVELEEHPEALRILQNHYGENLNQARRRMALMPKGALLFNNPPAFQIKNVFALAGIPSVMHRMFEALTDRLSRGVVVQSICIKCRLAENILADALSRIQDKYISVDIGSYPFFQEDAGTGPMSNDDLKSSGWGVNLVIRGTDVSVMEQAKDDIMGMIVSLKGKPEMITES
jgi:molybdenum cofactor synthesis domain-containing protein